MFEVTASASTSAPPARVWEILCDTARYADWVEGTAEVPRTDGPARQGGTYEEVNPILGPWKARTRWAIVEFEPERRQLHSSGDLPLAKRFDVIMEIAPEGEGTRATITLRAVTGGLIGAAFGALMRPLVARDNEKTVRNLVALAG